MNAETNRISLFRVWPTLIHNVTRSRYLIFQLLLRDLFSNFRRSFLGALWIFVTPLVSAGIWIFMNGVGIVKPGATDIPYPSYLIINTAIWSIFSGFYGAGSRTLSSGASFIHQVQFHHDALLIKEIAQYLFNFSIGFGINLILILILGTPIGYSIILLPVAVLPLLFLGAGLGLISAMLNVIFQDLERVFDLFVLVLGYTAPIYYSEATPHPFLKAMIRWNPFTYVISNARHLIIGAKVDHIGGLALITVFSFLFFTFCWWLFSVVEKRLIEKIGV